MSIYYTHDEYYLGLTAIVTIGMQLLFFLVAYLLQFDKVTDFAGSTNFILLALLTFFLTGIYDTRMIVITICTVLWGLRIAGYLLYRILQTESDTRFDDIRGNFWKFLGFWVFQMIWVWVVSLPTTLTNSPGIRTLEEFGTGTDLAGLIIFLVGLMVETIADLQKFKFNSQRTDGLDLMNQGLWYYSRHPNYFGEILVWWGIFLLSFSAEFQKELIYLGITSPLFTMVLLLFFSGIPQSEPQKDKRILETGTQIQKDTYFDYLRSTSPIIPLPPRVYRALPKFIKSIFLFEFSFYRYKGSRTPLTSQDV